MKEQKKIYLFSSFPILDMKSYFSKQAIKPIMLFPKLNKETLLPNNNFGISKSVLLKIEHELSVNSYVYLYGSFLNDRDFSSIRNIASKYNAEIDFTYFDISMPKLYKIYKEKQGTLSYESFCDQYINAFEIPYQGINKLFFESII